MGRIERYEDLSAEEKKIMEEDRLKRDTTPSISQQVYAINKDRYERWFSKRKGFRLHLTKARKVEGAVQGEWEIRPGLSIKFGGGELILDKLDPDYKLISKRLREHHYFDLKYLICVDDLDKEERKKTTQASIGISTKHRLRKLGIVNPKKQNEIMSLLDVKSQKDWEELEKKSKDQEAEIKRLKEEANARRDAGGSGGSGDGKESGNSPSGSPEGGPSNNSENGGN